jgi:hypothetical protein
MTNHEARMTTEYRMSNDETIVGKSALGAALVRHWSFVILSSFVLRHSSLTSG